MRSPSPNNRLEGGPFPLDAIKVFADLQSVWRSRASFSDIGTALGDTKSASEQKNDEEGRGSDVREQRQERERSESQSHVCVMVLIVNNNNERNDGDG